MSSYATLPKSKKAIVTALISLLGKLDFQKITIQKICDQAGIVRSTFYHHFEDKTTAAIFVVEHVTNLAKTATLDTFLTEDEMDLRNNLIRGYQITIKHHHMVKAMFSLHLPEADFEQNFKDILRIKTEAMIEEHKIHPQIPKELAINLYISNALLVTKYIAFHPETADIEQLADFMSQIYFKLLGHDPNKTTIKNQAKTESDL
ncbi:TetR/AcrR family transcriptional regulator [Streptococcus cameli]